MAGVKGAGGPAPTPTSILQMRGSIYRAASRNGEPVTPVEAPDTIPSVLGSEGKAEWRRIVPLLLARRTISKADRAALTIYCQAWEDWYKAAGLIKRMNAGTYVHRGKQNDHPRRVLSAAADKLLKTIAQFGLSPSTKTRIRAEGSNYEDAKQKFFPNGPAVHAQAG